MDQVKKPLIENPSPGPKGQKSDQDCLSFLIQAEELLQQGMPAAAYTLIKKASKRDFKHQHQISLYILKSHYYLSVRKNVQAEQALLKIKDLLPSNQLHAQSLDWKKHYILVQMYQGRLISAQYDCEQLLSEKPNFFELYPIYFDLLAKMGLWNILKKEHAQALTRFDADLSQAPNSTIQSFLKVKLFSLKILLNMHEWEKLASEATALNESPYCQHSHKIEILLILAQAYAVQKRPNKAWSYFNQALQEQNQSNTQKNQFLELHEGMIDFHLNNDERAAKILAPLLKRQIPTWEILNFLEPIFELMQRTHQNKILKEFNKKMLLFSIETQISKNILNSLRIEFAG